MIIVKAIGVMAWALLVFYTATLVYSLLVPLDVVF